MKYPVTTFVHFDNEDGTDVDIEPQFQEPNANSTLIEQDGNITIITHVSETNHSVHENLTYDLQTEQTVNSSNRSYELESNSVGHISHIPRTAPSPATYSIPSIINRSIGIQLEHEELFGMIKLRDNDVCYTSGTIEWVGRKRSFPINSGFKIMTEHEQPNKKLKKLNKSLSFGAEKLKECDCADVLPTVNAIVDHLNALHEAVDLIDLRLTSVEDTVAHH